MEIKEGAVTHRTRRRRHNPPHTAAAARRRRRAAAAAPPPPRARLPPHMPTARISQYPTLTMIPYVITLPGTPTFRKSTVST